MRRFIFSVCVVFIGSFSYALSLPQQLIGKTTSGLTCSLEIQSWEFVPVDSKNWFDLRFTARSSTWQNAENPALLLTRSPTPWNFYGRGLNNPDRMAVQLNVDGSGGEIIPESIQSYSFQTYDESRGGLIQEYCRFF